MRAPWIAVLLFAAPAAHAVTWPGAAPCNGTLQACIDAQPVAGEVVVASSGLIDQDVFVGKPFTLRAQSGYRPRITAGHVIAATINQAGVWQLTLEGFEVQRGFINVNVNGGGSATVRILDNRVLEQQSGAAEISVYTAAATDLYYEISGNQVDFDWSTYDGALRAAIQVLDSFATPSTQISRGIIADNDVTARGSQSLGILVSTRNRSHRVDVQGNRVTEGRSGSIMLRQGSIGGDSGGTLNAAVTSNSIRSLVAGSHGAEGLAIDLYDGAATLAIANNTINDALYGIRVYADAAVTVSGSIERNILTNLLSTPLTRSGPAAALTDSRNLFYRNLSAQTGVNANSINADPMFARPYDDARLRAGSPAIDVEASTNFAALLETRGIPALDADGLRRFKRGTAAAEMIDVGAYEFGDTSVLHTVDNSQPSPDSLSLIDHVALNDIPSAYPQVTANWNPDGGGGIYNDHPVSVAYSSFGDWYVRDEDLDAFTDGTRFNLWVPADGAGKYRHALSAGNTSGTATTLTQTGLNNHSEAIVLVARDSNGPSVTQDFTSPFGVRYVAPNWQVVNLAGTAMATVGGFNVYFQPPSRNAFRHVTSAGNNAGNHTFIDQPVLNGNACARVHVTRSGDGAANARSIGVYYAPSVARWAIFNQDLATMPAGVEFHVVVDPRPTECAGGVFANGFE